MRNATYEQVLDRATKEIYAGLQEGGMDGMKEQISIYFGVFAQWLDVEKINEKELTLQCNSKEQNNGRDD